MTTRTKRSSRGLETPPPINRQPYPILHNGDLPSSVRWATDRLATVLMAYGLHKTEISWNNAASKGGHFAFRPAGYREVNGRLEVWPEVNEIRLSRQYASVRTREEMDDTIRHEVAHALLRLYAVESHGPEFFEQYTAMGGRNTTRFMARSASDALIKRRQFTGWTGTCARGCTYTRKRLTASAREHGRCVAHHLEVSWVSNG